jgi:hypothetical protein
MKRITYPGKLGQYISKDNYFNDVWLSLWNGADFDAWVMDQQCESLMLLLNHFKIPRDSGNRWLHLAFRLACDHVPACQVSTAKAPGRPRKPGMGRTDKLRLVGDLGFARLAEPGKPGRRKKYTDERERRFLRTVAQGCARLNLRGHGAVSKYFRHKIQIRAHMNSRLRGRTAEVLLRRLRRRYSAAIKKYPQMGI